ncbi:MAG: response regulator [Prolixibacteraceae bacterium]|jgi:DNA-binding NtrC family response regulator|nr:response regulator [Prolixibacteraceae bacterium]
MTSEKKTILYIDDEEINLRLFKSTFRRNYNVITSQSAEEGLQVLENQHVDLIITDQRMPKMTGVQFLSMVQERFPDIPPGRLIISGYSDPEEITLAYNKYQLYKFIAKPWDQNELATIINEAIKK